jgi:hypothetical protein
MPIPDYLRVCDFHAATTVYEMRLSECCRIFLAHPHDNGSATSRYWH